MPRFIRDSVSVISVILYESVEESLILEGMVSAHVIELHGIHEFVTQNDCLIASDRVMVLDEVLYEV